MFNNFPLISKEVIDSLIEMAGDDSIIKELFTSYLDDLSSLSTQIIESADNGNLTELKSSVHKLKGVSGSIGAERMFECCKSIDLDLKNDVHDQLSSKIDELKLIKEDLTRLIKEDYV